MHVFIAHEFANWPMLISSESEKCQDSRLPVRSIMIRDERREGRVTHRLSCTDLIRLTKSAFCAC